MCSVFQGAFTFRGNMIDMPLLKQAQNYVQLQTFLNPSEHKPSDDKTTTEAAAEAR